MREDSDGQGATADKTILRVRKDSDDSVGSELSCSPPSSDDGDSGAPHARWEIDPRIYNCSGTCFELFFFFFSSVLAQTC